MTKLTALNALSQLTFFGTPILFGAAPQAAGQNPEPEKVHSPGQPQTPATVLTLPPTAKFDRFAQTAPILVLESPRPFQAHADQTVGVVTAKTPNALPPQVTARQGSCSVPLLRVQPATNKNFTIKQVPVPPIDSAMVVKPLAPSCDELTSVLKPGITTPLPPNPREP